MSLGRAQRATPWFVELYLTDPLLIFHLALLEYRHFRGAFGVCYSVFQRFRIPGTGSSRHERGNEGDCRNDREQDACDVLNHFVHVALCLEDLVGVTAQSWRKEGVHCDVGSLEESHDGAKVVVIFADVVFVFFE